MTHTSLAANLKAAKSALLAQMTARAELDGVQVTGGHPGDDIDVNATVFLHDASSEPADFGTLGSGLGGIPKRDTTVGIDVVVQVGEGGNDQQGVEDRALDLAAAVELGVRDDVTLGGTVHAARVRTVRQTNIKPENRQAWLTQVVLRVEGDTRVS